MALDCYWRILQERIDAHKKLIDELTAIQTENAELKRQIAGILVRLEQVDKKLTDVK